MFNFNFYLIFILIYILIYILLFTRRKILLSTCATFPCTEHTSRGSVRNLLSYSWANGKKPRVMISFENMPMRSLASRIPKFYLIFPTFFRPGWLLLAVFPLSRVKDFYNDL